MAVSTVLATYVYACAGAVHPPLYFHGGGIKSMLAVMKQHVRLVKTVADPNTYVVMEDAGPLSPELALDHSDVAMGGPPSHALTIDAPDECDFKPDGLLCWSIDRSCVAALLMRRWPARRVRSQSIAQQSAASYNLLLLVRADGCIILHTAA